MSNLSALWFSRLVFLILMILTVFATTVFCQTTGARPDRGVNPGGSYAVSDIENINLQNGNVNLSIPLASLPPIAGGKLGLTISANYNSKLWNMMRDEREGSALPYRTYVVDTPQLDDTSNIPNFGGWTIGGSYELFTRDARRDFNYLIPPAPEPNDSALLEYQRLTQHNWVKLVLRTPDGAEHELRPTGNHEMYVGQDHPRTYLWGYYKDTPVTTGVPMQYYSSDGSYISAIVNPTGHASGIRWTMFLPDGTQVISYADGVQRIRDNNGNSIKMFGADGAAHYQDEQTGREIKVTGDIFAGQQQVWYKTVGAVWQHIDINFRETVVKGKLYRRQDWNSAGQTETGLQGVECPHHEEIQPTTLTVVDSIVFPVTEPNHPGRRFEFTHNSDSTETAVTQNAFFQCGGTPATHTRAASIGMGALSHMVTPSGAVVDYEYSLDHIHDFLILEGADGMVRDGLKKKTLHHDGTEDVWQYTIPNQANSMVSSVQNPDGSLTTQHYFSTNPGFAQSVGDSDTRSGLVYYTSDGLTETYKHWADRGIQNATGSTNFRAVNWFVDAEYTSFVGTTLMSAKKYEYDYNGNLTQVKEYDWFDSTGIARGDGGVPNAIPSTATLLRETNTSYYTSSSNYQTRSLTSGVPSILNAVKETRLGPSVTQFSYDGQGYDTPPTLGNLTSQKTWDDVDAKWITSSQTYGTYGNLATKTDANLNVTQFAYIDATHAAPNQVIVDPLNTTGTQTTTTVFDFSTGAILSQTDPNGKVSNIDYTNQLLGTVDPFARPGIAYGPLVDTGGVPLRHRTITSYFDNTRVALVASDLNGNDQLLKTRTTSDIGPRDSFRTERKWKHLHDLFAEEIRSAREDNLCIESGP
jgi:hypothetical protein